MHPSWSIAPLFLMFAAFPARGDDLPLPQGAVARFVVPVPNRKAAQPPVIQSLAWGPSGRTLALGVSYSDKDDNTLYSVRLWDTITGTEKMTVGDGSCVAYSPDGKFIAWGGGWSDTVHVAVTTSAQPVRDIKSGIATSSFTFSADGRCLATSAGGLGSAVTIWDLPSGKPQPSPKGSFACFAFAADGRALGLGGTVEGEEKLSISIWDRATGKVRFSNAHEAKVLMPGALAFSPDGRVLAATGDKNTVLWDAATGKEAARFDNEGGFARALSFHPRGKFPAICYWDAKGERSPIRIWNLETGKKQMELAGNRGATTSLAFSQRGRLLATGGADGTVILWRMVP